MLNTTFFLWRASIRAILLNSALLVGTNSPLDISCSSRCSYLVSFIRPMSNFFVRFIVTSQSELPFGLFPWNELASLGFSKASPKVRYEAFVSQVMSARRGPDVFALHRGHARPVSSSRIRVWF